MTDLTTFPNFPNLPTELRLKIYTCLFPDPQIVAIRFSQPSKRYTTTSPPCPLLSLCSEAREHYLSSYQRLLLSPLYESSIFVDFTRDTLFFDCLSCSPAGDLALDLQRSPQREQIRRVAFDVGLWEVLRVFKFEGTSEVGVLNGLKSVALVLRREVEEGRDGDERYGVFLQQVNDLGRERDRGETVESEIRNCVYWVDRLREGVEESKVEWDFGKPNVQMWLW